MQQTDGRFAKLEKTVERDKGIAVNHHQQQVEWESHIRRN
jgi:hypothetical protein